MEGRKDGRREGSREEGKKRGREGVENGGVVDIVIYEQSTEETRHSRCSREHVGPVQDVFSNTVQYSKLYHDKERAANIL